MVNYDAYMKYKTSKLRLNEMHDFYFYVKFGLVFIYILNAYRKKYSSILLRKNLFNSLHFSFEKHVPFQVLKDFSISLLFLLFLSVFPLTDTNDSQNSREWRGNHHFSCFSLPLAREYSFSLPRFLPLLLNRSICNYQTNSWWDLFSL